MVAVRIFGGRIFGVLWAIGAVLLTAASPSSPLAAHDTRSSPDTTETLCSTALTNPDLCPCIITAAKAAGVSDEELSAIFADRDAAQAADRVQYNRFRRAEMQCARDTAMAAMMGAGATGPQIGAQPDGTYAGRVTGPQPLPSDLYIGQAPTRTLLARLRAVERESQDGTHCTSELFIVTPGDILPITAEGLLEFTRSDDAFRFATEVPSSATFLPAYLINFGGRDRVLSPTSYSRGANGSERYENGQTAMVVRRSGESITGDPAARFTPVEATLSHGAAQETFGALELLSC